LLHYYVKVTVTKFIKKGKGVLNKMRLKEKERDDNFFQKLRKEDF